MEERNKKQMEILRELRTERGLSKAEFSREMGIPLRTLEDWEAGRRKMPDYLLRMLVYYVRIGNMGKGMEEVSVHEPRVIFDKDGKM